MVTIRLELPELYDAFVDLPAVTLLQVLDFFVQA